MNEVNFGKPFSPLQLCEFAMEQSSEPLFLNNRGAMVFAHADNVAFLPYVVVYLVRSIIFRYC